MISDCYYLICSLNFNMICLKTILAGCYLHVFNHTYELLYQYHEKRATKLQLIIYIIAFNLL